MTLAIPPGRYVLSPGVDLVPRERGGLMLQETPLRVLRLNQEAFGIMKACRQGFSPAGYLAGQDVHQQGPLLTWLDKLCRLRFLEWQPAPGFTPFVSIIIPVYNRAGEIGECLKSLLALDYPEERREIIVVDDGSTDDLHEVIGRYPVRLLAYPENRGQSAARNLGVAAARGEIIAFIDSDCVAEPHWLSELTPYFQDPRVALVGGYVAAYYRETWLDRYEAAASPLNMGEHLAIGEAQDLDFYVPTCNLLVRRDAYQEVGGLDEALRFGEDVDLCWKVRKQGRRQLYVPKGVVRHKHRNRLLASARQRFHYGTSEPVLYTRHPEVVKRLPWQPWGLAFWAGLALSLWQPVGLGVAAAAWLGEFFQKKPRLFPQAGPRVYAKILKALLKNYLALAYYLTLHLVRYYLVVLLAAAVLFPGARLLILAAILLPVGVEYFRKKAPLNVAAFTLFFLGEQACYQTGVLWGSLKLRTWRCYRPHWVGRNSPGKAGAAVHWGLAGRLRKAGSQS
jgi:mycofactocin system glycosyltransferase